MLQVCRFSACGGQRKLAESRPRWADEPSAPRTGKGGGMSRVVRGILAASVALFVVATPLLYYRYTLTTGKRLRVVEPERFYRSGQMTVGGFTDTLTPLKIRTVINV